MAPKLSRSLALLVAVAAAFAACSDDGGTTGSSSTTAAGGSGSGAGSTTGTLTGSGGGVQCIANLENLAVSPQMTDVTLDGSANPPDVTFTASGDVNGQNVAIPGSSLQWTVTRADDTDPGTISNGVFSPYPYAGGTVTVTATDGCISASATVDLFLDVEVGQPTNPGDWAGTPVTTGTVPLIVYPSDETRFPRNLYRTLFQ